MKRALITGITGQDGSFLADLLLDKGYEVHGVIRRVAMEDPGRHLLRISHIERDIELHSLSLLDSASVFRLFNDIAFDECYHLASPSFVTYAFEDDFNAYDANISGTNHLLTAIRTLRPGCRMYFAGSSEMFGRATVAPQTEETTFHPRSFYGIAKVAGYHVTRSYRDAYDVYCCTGILYNHESERRGFEFVTRKISNATARIKLGLSSQLRLGNLDGKRDWGHAADYVRAMWLMLQQTVPDDYVIATGATHSVRRFVHKAFEYVGLDWREHVVTDDRLFRSNETVELRGDASKARKALGWSPTIDFDGLVEIMVEHDLQRLKNQGHTP